MALALQQLESRWAEWLVDRNARGMRGVLWIVLCLYPTFGLLDYLVAPPGWLWLLYGTRGLVTIITLALFSVLKTPRFLQHPNAISGSYMVLISLGISLMTVFMGGLASPYYAGLVLVIVGSGLLFVWPPPVVIATYSTITASFLLFNWTVNGLSQVMTAISNQFFLVSTAIIAGTGQILAYRSLKEQVQNQQRLETATQNLESAHDQLKTLDRFKSEFFANITHELKTPLTMVLAPLGLLIEGQLGQVSKAQRATFESMQRNGVKLSRLIGDLLDLSKLEESRLRLRVEKHDLVAYLRNLSAQVEPLAQRKALRLGFSSDVECAEVYCDLERMERVFINLLSNATKFTNSGGSVSVTLHDQGDSVLVEVVDTGVGFPSSMADAIFGRFVQMDMADTRRFGGAGIGLALAKELVELHGGAIWAESSVGNGARFSVRLLKDREHFKPDALERRGGVVDRSDGKRQSDGTLAEWQLDTSERFRLLAIDEATDQRVVERDVDEGERQHSVLVVEDTPDVARMIRLALHQEFRVLVAADGRQGLALARQHQPTVIVTDWMMPHMDGMELTRQLRREDRTRHIPVVMLTARGDVADRVSGLETGVNAYLAKPFAASELVSTVRSQVRSQVLAVDTLLVQKMDSLEVIAGGLAHEIRNPLNYLGNALITIERDCEALLKAARGAEESPAVSTDKLDARMHKMFEVAHAGMKRIAGTVDLMVRYSREGYSRSRRAYDAYAAVQDVIDVVAPTVSRSVEIKTELTGNGWVMCVAEELNQVLTNLVQNALEAVDEGSGVVEVRGSNDGDHLVLSVKDNGPGMSEDVRARVFDAFYTTKEVGRGLGMGLAIAQRVVTAMGGKLTLSTQLGVGSEFTLRVPSVAAGDAPA